MKRTASIVGIFLIFAVLLVGCGTEKATETTSGTTLQETTAPQDLSYFDEATGRGQIYTPEGLSLLRQYPDGEFAIMNDLDCGGMVWEPIPEFSGKLTGLWAGERCYTVSDLVISGNTHNSTFDLSLFNGNIRSSDLVPGQAYHLALYAGVADSQEMPVKNYSFTAA